MFNSTLRPVSWPRRFCARREEVFPDQTANAKGTPTQPVTQVRLDYPGIASLGISYTGLEHWSLASDFRYID
jgi:hypothetical protein